MNRLIEAALDLTVLTPPEGSKRIHHKGGDLWTA